MRRHSPWLIVVALLLVGCGDDVTLREAPRSIEYFARSRDFLNTATVLLNESRALWGQSLRAFYYAGFTIARAKDLDGLLADNSSIHDKVWNATTVGARRFFRDSLRVMRNRWDYEVRAELLPDIEEDFRLVALNGPEACAFLFKDARDSVDRQYRECPRSDNAHCDECRALPELSCLRAAAHEGLSEVEIMAVAYLKDLKSKVS